ncbi:Endopeptidase incomplete domain containing protein [Pandoravirus neocaledonia]|uniref:Endopeptidase incomplete domain containing protein n=1 Tax=Pandoravirus neocaledonia TaxID=2107708 RepID=A0A2U7UBJ3_9VIRU|nr:Endopeptidase incomplete domain containing protein [Pandoravirus neocaledonia]AVK75838.1 Endopeptidase incomplete domain containing protein [Pandoravirus neocaledonia]
MQQAPSRRRGGGPNAKTTAQSDARARPVNTHVNRSAPQWMRVVFAVALLLAVVVVALAAAAARMRRYVRTPPTVGLTRAVGAWPLRTGDLIITSNHDGRRGRSLADWSVPIKWVTGSPFNHVAVVYVEPDTRQLLFWEINGSGTRLATVRDLTCGRPHHDVFVRRVSPPVDVALFERAMAAQWEHEFNFFAPAAVAARVLGCRQRRDFYAHSLLDCGIVLGHGDGVDNDDINRLKDKDDGNNRDDRDRDCDSDDGGGPQRSPCARSSGNHRGVVHRRTCAHMVAELYHLVGVLDYARGRRGVDPAALCAGDFAKAEPDPAVLPMARRYRFGPLVRLEW